jgi:acyl transferase domain-containing protein
MFCLLGALSRHGQIRPFDKNADGTLLGEGLGMMVIKRREDAEKDGDRIYAVIKALGTASDGRGASVLVPRLEGESLAIERAFNASGISSESIGMIEAHGTATAVGDVTEIQSLTRVFGSRNGMLPSCAIGSVKSMIAHTIPAAGMAGMIKTSLALYHKILPPTLCDEINPKLELDSTPFYLNTETQPWIHGMPSPRRAGVSAFGFGGINAHAILEEYPESETQTDQIIAFQQWDSEVIIIQGDTRDELIDAIQGLLQFISVNPEAKIKDIAFTLNCPLRASDSHRIAIVTKSIKDLDKKLHYAIKKLSDAQCLRIKDRSGIFFFEESLGNQGKLAFLFPGEGSQYVNMLRDLCVQFPEVRSFFDQADRLFFKHNRFPLPSQFVFPASQSSPEQLEESNRNLWKLEYAVSIVFAATQGLNSLLDKLEIRPDAVVGHSTGDDSALTVSGVTVEQGEAGILKYDHQIEGLDYDQIPKAKLMTVGALDPTAVAGYVAMKEGEIYVAMDNCPNQMVLCGSENALKEAYAHFRNSGGICNYLPFDRAYHTPWYQKVCNDHSRPFIERLQIQPPKIDIYSCATTRLYPKDPEKIKEIMAQQWALPVRFRQTVENMYNDGVKGSKLCRCDCK